MKILFSTLFSLFLSVACGPATSEHCGDGNIDDHEDCDGDRFAPIYSRQCKDMGYRGGLAACTESCGLDLTQCEEWGVCGDGELAPLEDCDSGNFKHSSSAEAGCYTGEIACFEDSCDYDRRNCTYCGDGIVQTEFGEVCDGLVSGSASCADVGKWGNVTCSSDCKSADYSSCDGVMTISSNRFDTLNAVHPQADGSIVLFGTTGGNLHGNLNENFDCTRLNFIDGYEGYFDGQEGWVSVYNTCMDIWGTTIDVRGSVINSFQSGSLQNDFVLNTVKGNFPGFMVLSFNEAIWPKGHSPSYPLDGVYRFSFISEAMEIIKTIVLDLPIIMSPFLVRISETKAIIFDHFNPIALIDVETESSENITSDLLILDHLTGNFVIARNPEGELLRYNTVTHETSFFFSCEPYYLDTLLNDYYRGFWSIPSNLAIQRDSSGNLFLYCYNYENDFEVHRISISGNLIETITPGHELDSIKNLNARHRITDSGKLVFVSTNKSDELQYSIENTCNSDSCTSVVLSVFGPDSSTHYEWYINNSTSIEIGDIAVKGETVWIPGNKYSYNGFSGVPFLIKKDLTD